MLYTSGTASNMLCLAYMKLSASIGLALGRTPLDARLLGLLAGLEDRGSLAEACRSCEVSYRHGWGLVVGAERALGQPLATFARGRGATLTPLGAALVATHRRLADSLRPALADASRWRWLVRLLVSDSPSRTAVHKDDHPLA